MFNHLHALQTLCGSSQAVVVHEQEGQRFVYLRDEPVKLDAGAGLVHVNLHDSLDEVLGVAKDVLAELNFDVGHLLERLSTLFRPS